MVNRYMDVNRTDWTHRKALFGLTRPELTALLAEFGQKNYRAVQLGDALYKQRVGSLDEVTTFPLELRERLAAEGDLVGLPEIVQAAKSVDGTERYLMRMADGETVETVWMPDGDGGERGDGSEAAAEGSAGGVSAEEAVDAEGKSRSFASLRMTIYGGEAGSDDGTGRSGREDKRNWGALA